MRRARASERASESARSWTYLLLCADRENRVDAALAAASQPRTLGGSPDVPVSNSDENGVYKECTIGGVACCVDDMNSQDAVSSAKTRGD